MNLLSNYWYIGMASSRLSASPLPFKLGDENLVLFRDQEGQPHALADRCCHRGFQLSRGKIEGQDAIHVPGRWRVAASWAQPAS